MAAGPLLQNRRVLTRRAGSARTRGDRLFHCIQDSIQRRWFSCHRVEKRQLSPVSRQIIRHSECVLCNRHTDSADFVLTIMNHSPKKIKYFFGGHIFHFREIVIVFFRFMKFLQNSPPVTAFVVLSLTAVTIFRLERRAFL